MNINAKIRPNSIIIGNKFVHLDKIDSTNNLAAQMLKNGLAVEGLVVMAEHQTAGKGQGIKTWESEPYENLTFSVLLEPSKHGSFPGFVINKAAALTCLKVINSRLHGSIAQIKWPNDILVNKRKIAGILIETVYQGDSLKSCIVGVGINVNQISFDKDYHATSIAVETQRPTDKLNLLEEWIEAFEFFYLGIINQNTEEIEAEFNRNLIGFGRVVEIEMSADGTRKLMEVQGVDANGRLICSGKSYLHRQIRQIV